MRHEDHRQQTVIDFVTGKEIPDIGPEAMRQATERFLVQEKGFAKEDIEVNVPVAFEIDGEAYNSRVDLVVHVGDKRVMAVKCAAGSLGSREREILAAARITDSYQIPFALVSDGKTAILMETRSGEKIGEGLACIPSRHEMAAYMETAELQSLPEHRLFRERLIFRSYDSMNVNRDIQLT